MDQFALALRAKHADGTYDRFGGDEIDPRNVLQSGSFSTTNPGGFGSFSGQLARDVTVDQVAALSRFDKLQLYGAGGRTAWEGYDIAVPATKGDGSTVGISGAGYSQALSDDNSLVPVFVTRDLSTLGEPPLNRRIADIAAGITLETDVTSSADSHSIRFDGVINKLVGSSAVAEQWITAPGGSKFGQLAFQLDWVNASGQWNADIFASDSDTGSPSDGSYSGFANDGAIHLVSLSTARKYIRFVAYWNGAAATPTNPFSATFSHLAFYGNAGLTTHAITGEAPGIYGSDAVGWAVDSQLSGVTFAKQITASTFVIPELSFPDGASAQDIIEAANTYDFYDYFVWEGPTFVYAPRGTTGNTWRVRTDEGAVLDDQGEQAADTWTAVTVFYNEPTGEARVAGPSSLSARVDYTDSSLEITDSSNAAIAHSRKRIARLSLSFPTTKNGAIQIGAAWLADMASVEVQGDCTVTGWVRDSNGIPAPAWLVRAGDNLVIEDVSPKTRRIVETSYDIETRKLTATLDSPPHRIEAYLQQLSLSTQT